MPPVVVRVAEPGRLPMESREPFLEATLPVRPAIAKLLLFIPMFVPLPWLLEGREPLDLRYIAWCA